MVILTPSDTVQLLTIKPLTLSRYQNSYHWEYEIYNFGRGLHVFAHSKYSFKFNLVSIRYFKSFTHK